MLPESSFPITGKQNKRKNRAFFNCQTELFHCNRIIDGTCLLLKNNIIHARRAITRSGIICATWFLHNSIISININRDHCCVESTLCATLSVPFCLLLFLLHTQITALSSVYTPSNLVVQCRNYGI